MTERKLKFISEIMQEKDDEITLLSEENSALSGKVSALSDKFTVLQNLLIQNGIPVPEFDD